MPVGGRYDELFADDSTFALPLVNDVARDQLIAVDVVGEGRVIHLMLAYDADEFTAKDTAGLVHLPLKIFRGGCVRRLLARSRALEAAAAGGIGDGKKTEEQGDGGGSCKRCHVEENRNEDSYSTLFSLRS